MKPVPRGQMPRLGSAEKVVLCALANSGEKQPSWSWKGGKSLYETRALTEMVCQRLVSRGYLDETYDDNGSVTYRLNQIGANEAHNLAFEFYR